MVVVVVEDAITERFSSLPNHNFRIRMFERVQSHLVVAISAVQSIKIGDPVRPQHNGFPGSDERGFAEPERGLGDQRVPISAPVVAALGQ
jgi:hypothetical protein